MIKGNGKSWLKVIEKYGIGDNTVIGKSCI